MAKKKKKTKRKKCKKLEPWVYVQGGCVMELTLSSRLEKEPDTLRRLAHRAVDLVADAGHYHWLARSVAGNLADVADDLVVEHMNKLVDEVRAEGKQAARC